MSTEYKKIYEAVKDDRDFKEGDVHQAILNVYYNRWQNHEFKGYEEMVRKCEAELGKLAAFSILFGKYNQQVCNGGTHSTLTTGTRQTGAGAWTSTIPTYLCTSRWSHG